MLVGKVLRFFLKCKGNVSVASDVANRRCQQTSPIARSALVSMSSLSNVAVVVEDVEFAMAKILISSFREVMLKSGKCFPKISKVVLSR